MNDTSRPHPFFVFMSCIVTFIAAYYFFILIHEWGHGMVAWIFKQKSSPFDIEYGGWALLHVDEHVDYAKLIAMNHGVQAALIGIAGPVVSVISFIICLFLIAHQTIQKKLLLFTFIYWGLILNLIPLLQYFTLTAFSSQGDTGRFLYGLSLSPWWFFIPGTFFICASLWHIFRVEIPRAYACIPIKSISGQRIFLLVTLCILFLLIYTHGYNPLSDKGTNLISKVLAIISILLVPFLFLICDPSRLWVKKMITR